MKKYDSLVKLEILNLNIPEVLYFQKAEPDSEDIIRLDLLLRSAQHRNLKLSVRTEKPSEFKSPFLPNKSVPEVRKFLESIRGGGFEVLITRGIPTNGVVRGNCVPDSYSNYFEYLVGPGTVRDIDEAGRTPKNLTLVWGQRPDQLGSVIASALQLVNSYLFPRRFDFNNQIVEFSVFSKPVGIKHEKVIFWEIRDYGGGPARVQSSGNPA